jgi:putative DNA primase/helicase
VSAGVTGEIIAKALGGRKTGGGWMARCPAHDDREPRLSMKTADGGRVLARCHAGRAPGERERAAGHK